MKIVTSQEMAAIDRRAQEDFGIPGLLLMENAGQKAFAAWRAASESCGRRMVFVAGAGNNGGDALVMARQAHIEGVPDVAAVPVSAKLKGNAELHLDILRRLGVPIFPWDSRHGEAVEVLEGADVVFDGIAGTGIRGGLRRPLSDIVEAINASRAEVVAVDVPSGLADDYRSGNPLVHAHMTLTMGLPKRCLYLPRARSACGDIRRIALGFPPVLTTSEELLGELLGEGDVARMISPVGHTDYKHRRGVLAVYAGSRGTSGAAALGATAAARTTAGMVRVFADEGVYPVLAAQMRSVMVAEWSGDDPVLEGHDAVLVGPGWGRGPGRMSSLSAIFDSAVPGVLDADGINLLAEMRSGGDTASSWQKTTLGGRWVLTPHAGEFARLLEASLDSVLEQPFETAMEAARELDAVVVLKSHVTVIAGPEGRYAVLDGMNPAMGTGGTGDVLSGIIAAFIARGAPPYSAAVAGVVLHDAVGKRCFEEHGWFIAEDLLEVLSRESARLLR